MAFLKSLMAMILAFFASFSQPQDSHAPKAPPHSAKHLVVLAPGDAAHLGVQTDIAKPEQFTPRVHGYGVVISLSAVGQTDADISTAQAAVHDSRAALERARKLYNQPNAEHAMSLQALDTAQHQALSDQAALALADRKEVATFGQNAPWRQNGRDSDILQQLTSGKVVLVQATFPLSVSFRSVPTTLTITRLNTQPGERSWTSDKVWEAPADPTIPGRSFFALAENSDLAQGEHLLIYAPTGAAMSGVSISSDAVVLSEDRAWCYVYQAPDSYKRIPIDLSNQLPTGYFVSKGIAPGDRVVVKGTGLLLSRELGAATPGED